MMDDILLTILRTIPDVVYISRAGDGLISYVNPVFIKTLNYTYEEAVGKTALELELWADPQHREALMEELEKKGELSEIAIDYRIKRGQYVSLSMSYSLIETDGEKCVLSIGRAITERKQAEEELRLQSKITFNLSEGVCLHGMEDLKIVYTNPRFETMFGYGPGEMLGQRATILNAPTDKTPEQTAVEIMDVMYETGEWHGEVYNIKKDGTPFWCYANAATFDHPQYGKVMVFAATDITDRKRSAEMLRISEERFQLAVDGSNDGIWELDLKSNVVYFSPRYRELLGYLSEDEFPSVLESFLAKLHPDDRARTLEAGGKHLEEHERYHIEYRLRTKDGSYRWFVARGQAIWDEDGNPIRMAGSISDITDRKHAETELENHREHLEQLVVERTAELAAARTEAERSNQAKSDFLSHMSHELRTPLNAVLGFGQMLELDANEFSDSQRGSVKEILDAGRHLLDLINDMLDLTVIESGKMEISMVDVPVDDILRQCISVIGPQSKVRRLDLIDHLSGKGYMVKADPTRLKQVLLNLLSNAVKYNREHGGITLDGEIIDRRILRIRVTDTGAGLTKQDMSKLFTPFERLDRAYKTEGTGIGLVITKYLIELMGGTVGVESTLGEGCTFWVELALSGDG